MKRIIIPLALIIIGLFSGSAGAGFIKLTGVSVEPERPIRYPQAITPVTHTNLTCITPTTNKAFMLISPATILYALTSTTTTPTFSGSTPSGFLLPALTPSVPLITKSGFERLCVFRYSGALGTTAVYIKYVDTYPGGAT
jgi:hypothetical protein